MKITLIAALTKNRVIGKDNKMLWHLPKDFAWFKNQTMGHNVVMGRSTMENILTYTKGKPLPGRKNYVLSRTLQEQEGFQVISDYQTILELAIYEEVMIIGGEQLFNLFLPYARRLILTEIDKELEGDTFFPLFNKADYDINFLEENSENFMNFNFVIYEKKI